MEKLYNDIYSNEKLRWENTEVLFKKFFQDLIIMFLGWKTFHLSIKHPPLIHILHIILVISFGLIKISSHMLLKQFNTKTDGVLFTPVINFRYK